MKKKTINGNKEIPSDIVFQVLARLPIKGLDRFKCVSKSWSSMISHPEFIKAHRPCTGIFINLFPISIHLNSSPKGLFYASIHGNDELARRLSLPYFGYEDITPIINGLACLYTAHQVSVFNVTTRELMALPADAHYVSYALGFDPVDNVYKVLKFSTLAINQLVHKILTLKTSSKSTWRWREIFQKDLSWFHPFPKVQSYPVNGIIYFKIHSPSKEYFLAFDVHQEHFTILNRPREEHCRLTVFGQFEGRLALAHKTQFET
ncbi:PREDICTED: putative F-box protein At3g10240, partial [Nicotiana attenuata]|uniref:putative F-box protein At3g10240 n=1 Tax=Nicotiana attenuata TaxID=49451 RepID=UPI000905AC51